MNKEELKAIEERAKQSPSMGWGVTHYQNDVSALLQEVRRLQERERSLTDYDRNWEAVARREYKQRCEQVEFYQASAALWKRAAKMQRAYKKSVYWLRELEQKARADLMDLAIDEEIARARRVLEDMMGEEVGSLHLLLHDALTGKLHHTCSVDYAEGKRDESCPACQVLIVRAEGKELAPISGAAEESEE